MSAPLLRIENVHAGYASGVDILQGLTLSVEAGSLTLVIGPNGAGKSTLLKTVFGFLKAHEGSITFKGEAIGRLGPAEIKRRGIAYVPQEINVFPLLTVEDNLRMGGWLLRRDPAALRRQIDKVHASFPLLAQRRREPAGSLSGGQGRMLSVAREMMTDPQLMLVDEPTAGLAPNLVDQVYEHLQTARRVVDSTILLVDQNIDDAIAQADTVYMVNLGRIKAEGPASAFPPERVRTLVQECLLG